MKSDRCSGRCSQNSLTCTAVWRTCIIHLSHVGRIVLQNHSVFVSNNSGVLSVVGSSCFVVSSSFSSCSSSPFIRIRIKRGGLAVCAVGGGRVSVLFCSFIGWGCEWKALRTRSPLFLSSCVLTFSFSLSLSPSRTTH